MKTSNILGCVIALLALSSCASSSKSETKINDQEKAKLLLDVAGANLTENDPTSALIALNEVRELDDSIPEEHYLFALAYYQKKETKLAIASARRAIKLKPDFSSAKNTLGKLLLDEGKFDEAEKYLTEASKDLVSRDAYLAKTNLGVLHYKKMNLPLANQWFTAAIDEGKTSACMASYYRGLIRLEKKEFEKARQDLLNGSRGGCSQLTEGHLAYAQSLIRLKKYDQARAKLLEIKQLFPNSDASQKANDYLRDLP